MFSFLHVKTASVTTRLLFLLFSTSAIILSKLLNIFCFLFGLYSSMLLYISSKLFKYSMKASESFNCFVPTPSCFLIKNCVSAWYRSLWYK